MLNVSSVSRLGLTLLISMAFPKCDQKIHIRKQREFNSSMLKAGFLACVTLAIVITSCDGGVS